MVTQINFVLQECQNHSYILVLIEVFLGQKYTSLSWKGGGCIIIHFYKYKREVFWWYYQSVTLIAVH